VAEPYHVVVIQKLRPDGGHDFVCKGCLAPLINGAIAHEGTSEQECPEVSKFQASIEGAVYDSGDQAQAQVPPAWVGEADDTQDLW